MIIPASPARKTLSALFPAREREALPIAVPGRRIRLLPTREGLIFFALLSALLFGSINHNNNLGFILTFLLGGMSFISMFHTYRNLAGVILSSVRAQPVFAGQHAAFTVTLENRGISRHGLSLYFSTGKPVGLDLSGDTSRTVTVFHHTENRGLLKPDRLSVATTYPFGLFSARAEVLPAASCLVYPKPVSGPIISTQGQGEENDEGEPGGTGVDDFAGLASYQRGDPLQHISWKTYSRGQGLHTKKFEGQQGGTVYFDPDALPGRDIEMKLSRICFMVLHAEACRIPYGLKLGNCVIPPDLGGPHKRKCLRKLALTGGKG